MTKHIHIAAALAAATLAASSSGPAGIPLPDWSLLADDVTATVYNAVPGQ